MRILITGGSGLLAVNWALCRRNTDEVWLGTHTRKISIPEVYTTPFELTSHGLIAQTIKSISPDVIIYAAALTNIEECENDPATAFLVNSRYAGLTSKVAFEENVKFVYVSTDQVFNGKTPFNNETDLPEPVNVYGLSKLDGENIVKKENPNALILRVNFFGWGPAYRQSLSDWILTSLAQARRITLYDNVIFNPLNVSEIIEAAHDLLSFGAEGIYNLANSEAISKYDFGLKLADRFKLDRHHIARGSYDSNNTVPRPLNMTLANNKFLNDFQGKSFSIKRSIAKLSEEYEKKRLLSSLGK